MTRGQNGVVTSFPVWLSHPLIAVGTALASRPPHRSGRADFPHPAPASGHDALPDVPAQRWITRLPGSESGTRHLQVGSPWPAPFPPSPPPPVSRLCSGTSPVLRGCLTSRARPSSACVLRLPDAASGPYPEANAGSPGSRARCFRACSGPLTARSPHRFSRKRATESCLPHKVTASALQSNTVFAAQYPARTFPCQRFDPALTSDTA